MTLLELAVALLLLKSQILNLFVQAIIVLLGSSLVATLITNWYDSKNRKEDDENKRLEALYKPLGFHLMTINIVDGLTAKVMVASNEAHKGLKEYQIGSDRYVELSQEIFRSEAVKKTDLTKKWWTEVDQIANLFRNNSGKIKLEDTAIVREFLEHYTYREMITGKSSYTKIPLELRQQLNKENQDAKILEVVNKLKRKFNYFLPESEIIEK